MQVLIDGNEIETGKVVIKFPDGNYWTITSANTYSGITVNLQGPDVSAISVIAACSNEISLEPA